MANSIALAQRYAPILDELYKWESKTAILDAPENLVMWEGADTAKIFKTSLDGFGDYSRNSGYVAGSVTGSWETMTLAYERGRSFAVDVLDNEETLDLAFGTLAGEFVRTKEVPEIDAYTFAKISGTAGIGAATPDELSDVADILAAIDEGQEALDNGEAPMEGRILFVSPACYYAIKGKLTRFIQNDEFNVNRNIEMLDNTRVISVPQNRFNSAIELLDGSTVGQEAGGYTNVPSAGYSYPINFMLLHPSAIVKVIKHRSPRIFAPDVVQDLDGWKFNIRVTGDVFVKDNKKAGIYLHRSDVANS